MKTYPHYYIWKDPDFDCYEIVRWDNHRTAVVVQTNILTREKAQQAALEWRKREQEKSK